MKEKIKQRKEEASKQTKETVEENERWSIATRF
jgi:hypothetical protein